jgi:hypothetical protein
MSARRHEVSPLTLAVAVALLFGVAGCGGLDTPDLSSGIVSGRLVGAKPGAYVYAYGRPDWKVPVAADGTYEVRAPAGSSQVVLFDGESRAELHAVEVKAASRSEAREKRADEMPLAARVVVLARANGGARVKGVKLGVERTDQDRESDEGRVELFPVPEGQHDVRGALKGFRETRAGLSLSTRGYDAVPEFLIEVELDPDDSAERGCVSTSCEDSRRKCGEDDGRCHECDDDPGEDTCGAGLVCDHHVCVPADGAVHRDTCEPCVSSAQCGGGTCYVENGNGLCVSPDSRCDAGLKQEGTLCLPAGFAPGVSLKYRCDRFESSFGASCLTAQSCQDLHNGTCYGANGTTPGYCTAACSQDSDCPDHMRTCHSSLKVCIRS